MHFLSEVRAVARLAMAGALLAIASVSTAHAQSGTQAFPRNVLICGDSTTCPWQRGTSIASIANTATSTADGWSCIGGASSSITFSQGSNTTVNGFAKTFKMQRANANADTAALHCGQVLDTADYGTSLQGKNVCFSIQSLLADANFSATNGLVTFNMIAGTGSNQGYASMTAGTWTGTSTFASVTANLTQSGLAQSISKCALAPGNATEIGIDVTWTPVGTAGTADAIEFTGVQLEAVAIGTNAPTAFENMGAGDVLRRALRRSWVIVEPAASVAVAKGSAYTTALCLIQFPFPVPMRAAPTVTFAGTSLSASTWATISASATPIVLASTFLVQSSLGANTVYNGALKATGATTPYTAGNGCDLVGAGGGSKIVWSADLN